MRALSLSGFTTLVGLVVVTAIGFGCGSSATNPQGTGAAGGQGTGAAGGQGTGAAGGQGTGASQGTGGTTAAAMEDALVEATCGQQSECGTVQVMCVGEEGPVTCDAFLQTVPYAQCEQTERPPLHQLLTCVAPTATQLNGLQACADGIAAQACPSQEELDEYADAVESGTAAEAPPGTPAACAVLDELLHACDAAQGCQEIGGGSSTVTGGTISCESGWQCPSGQYFVSCSGPGPYTCSCGNGLSFVSDACGPSVDQVNAGCGYSISE